MTKYVFIVKMGNKGNRGKEIYFPLASNVLTLSENCADTKFYNDRNLCKVALEDCKKKRTRVDKSDYFTFEYRVAKVVFKIDRTNPQENTQRIITI